jgi:hypothetical protein
MSKDKAPMEFWIDENWAVGACDEMHLCVYDKEVDGIHVIEYSAYAALEAKLAEKDADLKLMIEFNETEMEPLRDRNIELNDKLAELMPQVEKLVKALEQYPKNHLIYKTESPILLESKIPTIAALALTEWQEYVGGDRTINPEDVKLHDDLKALNDKYGDKK